MITFLQWVTVMACLSIVSRAWQLANKEGDSENYWMALLYAVTAIAALAAFAYQFAVAVGWK